MRRSGVLRFAVLSALVVASRGRRNCTDVIPDGALGNVADWWGTNSSGGNSSGGDFTRCDGVDVVEWILENEGYACREKNKWVEKGWCQRTCYDIGASVGGSWGRDGADARFMYADCGTAADSAEDVSILVAADALDGTIVVKLAAPCGAGEALSDGVSALSSAMDTCDGDLVRAIPSTSANAEDHAAFGLDRWYYAECACDGAGKMTAGGEERLVAALAAVAESRVAVDSVTVGLAVTHWGAPGGGGGRALRGVADPSGAADDPTWLFRRKEGRGCAWVAKRLFRRCDKAGAEERCAATCATDGQGVRSALSDRYYVQDMQENLATAGVVAAWERTVGAEHVVVQVVDSGLDLSHEDHQKNIWVNEGEICGNGVDDDGNGYVDDCHGYNFADDTGEDLLGSSSHGTFCSGILAASRNNEKGIAGVVGGNYGDGVSAAAKRRSGAKIMTGVLFGDTGTRGMAEALAYGADNGARVSSNSWGYQSPGYMSPDLAAAIDYAVAKDVVVVFAAGNSGKDDEYFPARYAPTVAVASTDDDDEIASFSNYGAWIDVAAPGKSLVSTKPNDAYGSGSGTSYSAPTVSGILAMGFSLYPAATAAEARNCLTVSAGGARDVSGVAANAAYYARDTPPLGADGGVVDAEGFLDCLAEIYELPAPSNAPVSDPTPRPSRRPTPRPTPAPVAAGACSDDAGWVGSRRGSPIAGNDCARIARKGPTELRCGKKSLEGVSASEACGCACAGLP